MQSVNKNNNGNIRQGYVLIEAVVYILIISIVLFTTAIIFNSVINQYRHTLDKSELSEIASVVEDKIRMEMKNCVGIVSFSYPYAPHNDDMREVRGITYDVYNKDNKELINRRKILLNGSVLYIGEIGIYQCGNYIDKMFVKEYSNSIGKREKLDIKILYRKNDTTYESSFTIFFV